LVDGSLVGLVLGLLLEYADVGSSIGNADNSWLGSTLSFDCLVD